MGAANTRYKQQGCLSLNYFSGVVMILSTKKESSSISDSRIHKYVIMGQPVPLMRPRIKGRTCYDSQRHIKLIQGIGLRNQLDDKEPLVRAVSMTVTFYMTIPVSWSEKKKQAMIGRPHTSTPDYSNLLKYVEDVCVDVKILRDDALIYECIGRKVYDENPRTEFLFVEIE